MNDSQILAQLAQTDAYAPGTEMPSSAWSRETARSQIERRMGMETHESHEKQEQTVATERQEPAAGSYVARKPLPTNRRRAALIAAGAFAVTILVVAGVALLSSDDEPVPFGAENSDPAATIEAYVTAYNTGDIDGVMALFSEESVVTGHPFAGSSTGLTEIRTIQVRDIVRAASENAYTISNVEVTDSTVTWDHVWINSEGEAACKFGHSAVVEDGTIVSWTWPGGGFDCP